MSFVQPALLLWLIPLCGIIIALYLLRMRRKDLRVPATFLWPSMIYEIRANSFFQKLRFSWLLVLQLLAMLLAVLALARPQRQENSLAGQSTVIVVDASASMSATDVSPSRFEEAARIARSVAASAKPGDRVAVIEAGPVPRVVSPLSNDPARVRLALDNIRPSDADADVGEAMRLAASIVAKQKTSRIILLSDGVFPDISNFSAGNAQIVFQKIGLSDENSGISALGTSETPSGPQMFCSVRNYGSQPTLGTLDITVDGALLDSYKIELKPHATIAKTLAIPGTAKLIQAKIQIKDDILPADNQAATIRSPGANLRVLLVGKGDLFLEHALSLDPRVTLFKSTTPPDSTPYDVVVFDGTPEKPVNATGVLTFGGAGAGSPVDLQGSADKPAYTSAEKAPLLKAVDLSQTYVAKAETVRPKSDARVVASAANGPLIVESEGVQRHVYVSFSPLDSDFPLQPSFPIFIANSLDFLSPSNAAGGLLEVPAGRTFALPAIDPKGTLSIVSPSGDKSVLKPDAGAFVVRDLRSVGQYDFEDSASKKKTTVFARFPDEAESAVKPLDKVMLGNKAVAGSPNVLRLTDWWRYVAMLALIVLGCEWWLFARRS